MWKTVSWFEVLLLLTLLPGIVLSILRVRATKGEFDEAEDDDAEYEDELRRIGLMNIETVSTILAVQLLFLFYTFLALCLPAGRFPEASPFSEFWWWTLVYTMRTLVECAVAALTANSARAMLLRWQRRGGPTLQQMLSRKYRQGADDDAQ